MDIICTGKLWEPISGTRISLSVTDKDPMNMNIASFNSILVLLNPSVECTLQNTMYSMWLS